MRMATSDIAKMIASVAMSAAIGVVGYKTEKALVLWALYFVAVMWV